MAQEAETKSGEVTRKDGKCKMYTIIGVVLAVIVIVVVVILFLVSGDDSSEMVVTEDNTALEDGEIQLDEVEEFTHPVLKLVPNVEQVTDIDTT